MGKSGRVRLREIRLAYRLIHDCRDVGHNPAAWPVVLAERLPLLVDAQLCLVGELEVGRPGHPARADALAEHGWPSPSDRALWQQRYLAEQDFRRTQSFQTFMALRGNLVTRSREQFVSDAQWYRSVEFNEIHQVMRLDDLLVSALRTNPPGTLQMLSLVRPLDQNRFAARERRLLRLFHHELARHLGTTLVRQRGEPLLRLPLRLGETLRYLLEGDSEKQVAVRMGLSRHTVHEYVTELYRRLGVSSRPELMALCLRQRSLS